MTMKFPLVFVLIFWAQTLLADHQFKIEQNKQLLSTSYDVTSEARFISRINREHLQVNTIYTLSDEMGEYARGIAKLFSLGTLVKSMREIDIFNDQDKRLGSIKGTILTTAKGKFTFYNRKKKALAIAYIDRSASSITIVDASDKWNLLGLFRRAFVPEEKKYSWEVMILDEHALDPALLYIFGAFVSDTYWPWKASDANTESWESLKLLKIIKEWGKSDS